MNKLPLDLVRTSCSSRAASWLRWRPRPTCDCRFERIEAHFLVVGGRTAMGVRLAGVLLTCVEQDGKRSKAMSWSSHADVWS